MTETIIAGAELYDGSGAAGYRADVTVRDGVIAAVAPASDTPPEEAIDARGLALAPGFIDAHTHDDLVAITAPAMTPKITQGVTTVVVGNCGISAGAGRAGDALPDPMVLLGAPGDFAYADFAAYAAAVDAAMPATNVVALVGHTALRARHLDRLDRDAAEDERAAMRADLAAALDAGAFGLSTGLAYANAAHASTEEVMAVAAALRDTGALYATHLRSEGAAILPAIDEAVAIARHAAAPLVVSHLKCAGASQYGRSGEILARLEAAAATHPTGCDCYPYTASSSTLDLKQVVPETPILITWSEPAPDQAGRMLADIAADWGCNLRDAAQRLQPAGAVYHCMAESDVDRILAHPLTMIGSDGLPCDPRPHPRLWGSFPRVLAHYVRERGLLALPEAIRKMTGLTADRLGLRDRGYVRAGLAADLVLFDPARVLDRAGYDDPVRAAEGVLGVWVNGVATLDRGGVTGARGGRLLRRPGAAR
ncbi:amidohydrolase family protein [Sphingomonas sp. BK345]|uniref:N-acyl-D-amino-acid deacylase family protein n=1 Tax=Sphingomonas sp. BK345 TaxID=2586980 RepID=UPI0016076E86|nr:D-aminoacylase [Sphingomonas sp. BK345]MBB3475406.1 N-acyl-D-aspartate/D-glutamate deacylase [Sphingomonas sp. BK345]